MIHAFETLVKGEIQMINVAIIDNREMVRTKIKERLQSENIKIVSEGTSSDEMLNIYEEHITDVIISEVDNNKKDTIHSVKKLLTKRPQASIIILTSDEDKEFAKEMIRLGVKGYLFKTNGRNEIKEAIANVKNGHSYIDGRIIHEIMLDVRRLSDLEEASSPKPIFQPPELLIPREWEILQQLAFGHNNETISKNMFLSVNSIKNYVSNILNKLGAEHRTQAVVLAIKNNWVLV
ncbi:response regulator transcription factor [Bacillus sp. Cr_A10]|uniref:LuxR C-terminal-related transcriptional regulator n=1 Tax=Bacillus sp. Cr_A10 TaxID=3033993 RepID=UPI0023D9C371|nr:response regulator transcription factor [Bacillus sp. Cr_A10]MDF2067822.1 response regulator transcription factor [Bacillus sp. Cr_A10]